MTDGYKMGSAAYQREWRRKRGSVTLGIKFPCESCGKMVVRTGPLKKFCTPCARKNKDRATRAYQERNKKGTGPGTLATCECGEVFIRTGSRHVFCSTCIVERVKNQKRKSSADRRKKHLKQTRIYQRKWMREHNEKVKLKILTHYGKGGNLMCCWRNCTISDIDMLSLDHVLDNGAEERRSGLKGGQHLYARLLRENFPNGFQTLCFNHQFKKDLPRRRRLRI